MITESGWLCYVPEKQEAVASMRPRSDDHGKAKAGPDFSNQGNASMRPRSDDHGKMMNRNAVWSLKNCFNEAAIR